MSVPVCEAQRVGAAPTCRSEKTAFGGHLPDDGSSSVAPFAARHLGECASCRAVAISCSRAGCPRIGEALYAWIQPTAASVAWRRAGDLLSHDDCFQLAIMTAFRVINTSPKLAPSETLMDSDPAPLLRISMNNKITDAVRSELRRSPNHTEDIDELDDHTQLGTARPDFLSQIADRQAARAAIAELQRLIEDEPHNKDLFLAVFARLVDEPEALTQTEIAERFGMSQATVSRTLARLRSAMRDAASRHLDVPEES